MAKEGLGRQSFILGWCLAISRLVHFNLYHSPKLSFMEGAAGNIVGMETERSISILHLVW